MLQNDEHLATVAERLRAEAAAEGIVKLLIGCVVAVDGRILLIKRSSNELFAASCFEIPGGNVEHNEPVLEAVRRELFEETGLRCRAITQLIETFDSVSELNERVRQLNYAVELDCLEPIRLSAEHVEFVWWNYREPEFLTSLPMLPIVHNSLIRIAGKMNLIGIN